MMLIRTLRLFSQFLLSLILKHQINIGCLVAREKSSINNPRDSSILFSQLKYLGTELLNISPTTNY